MIAKKIVALLLMMAALACREEGKHIVIVHLHTDAIEDVAAGETQVGRAGAFEQAVLRAVVASPDCGPILIAREVQGSRWDLVQDLLRRPHWDLTIAWVDNDDRQSWALATDDYKRVLSEGMGSAQDISRAVCLQSREADGDDPGKVSVR
jgi:hypothetical protein